MKVQKILLPVDVASCPVGVFEVVNRLGTSAGLTVTLLHVVTLNIMGAENRIYEELGLEARASLEKLAFHYLRSDISVVLRVLLGKPAEQILTQARTDRPDLILLSVHIPVRKRLAAPWRRRPLVTIPALARKILRTSDFDVMVVPVDTCFDCRKIWGRLAKDEDDQPSCWLLPRRHHFA